MKIIVHNYKNQFALSRRQIEIISATIPEEYFKPIKEFHITPDSMGQERFEFNYKKKIAYFEYPVEHKDDEIIKDAITHLLVGLKRIKKKDIFGHVIPKNKKDQYLVFSDKWLQACFNKIKNAE